MLPITVISTSITSLLFFVASGVVFVAWRKQKSASLYYFLIFLVSFGFQQLFFALAAGPASGKTLVSNILWAAAHLFMFLGISYFLRFPVSVRLHRLEKIIFKLTFIYSAVGTVIIFLSASQVKPFLLESGVYNWKVPVFVGATIGIFTTLCLLFAFIIFITGAIKVKEMALKLRSIFLALGVLIFLIAGPMHNFVSTPLLNLVADTALVAGAILLLFGIFTPKLSGGRQ